LSGVLHVLLHMAGAKAPTTSDVLAKAMGTNPVVIRRVLAGLREAGYVRSEKGHGGGWTIACDLSRVTLRDIYEALGEPTLLSIGNRTDAPACLVEASVNAALEGAFREAELLLLNRLAEITLEALSAEFRQRSSERYGSADIETVHG